MFTRCIVKYRNQLWYSTKLSWIPLHKISIKFLTFDSILRVLPIPPIGFRILIHLHTPVHTCTFIVKVCKHLILLGLIHLSIPIKLKIEELFNLFGIPQAFHLSSFGKIFNIILGYWWNFVTVYLWFRDRKLISSEFD